jgi:hypothetical protein
VKFTGGGQEARHIPFLDCVNRQSGWADHISG